VGKEPRAAHALRVGTALAQLRTRPWPFKGRIGVLENGATRGDIIVLDRWCYLGTVRSETELGELEGYRPPAVFDLDTYKILTRFFARPRGDYTVIELAA
jgi:DNA polymerase-3 subunit epsilon